MVRDRLAEFQARSSETPDAKWRKKEANGTPLLSSEQRLTDCLADVTSIDDKLKKMKVEIGQMIKLQKNILSNPLIDKTVVMELEKAADRVFNTLTQLRKEISSYRTEFTDMHLDNNHERVVLIQLDRLGSDVTRAMNDFRAAQVEYIEKSKKLHNKKVEIVGGSSGSTDNADPSSSHAVFGADFLMEAQKAKLELRELEVREQEIKKIENSVVEVNKLFKEINALIMEQGETIDTIEKHVETAVADVEGGNKQLGEARNSQIAARRKKLCCVGIVVVVVIIVGVIVTIMIVNNSN